MNLRILKYVLENKMTLVLDGDANPMHLAEQHGTPVVWVQHEAERNWRTRLVFILLMTGEHAAIPDTARYVGTVMLSAGSYVLHCYVTKEIMARPNETGK